MAENKKLFLLDAMALIYRAHFALASNPVYNSKGLNTSAVYGFTNSLLDILNNQSPTHIAVAFDTSEPTHRHEEFEEYKAQRDEMPEDLGLAIPLVHRLLEGFNIPAITAPGFEADDIIGTLAVAAGQQGFQTYMVTPDKDFAQLVTENTLIYKPGRMGSGAEVLGVPEILDKWKVERVDQVIDILGLMGDKSDNIPGVPGIGEKTAQKLIAQFGSVEQLLESTDQLKGKQKEKVEANKEQARLSKRLVTILTDVPLDVELDSLKRKRRSDEKLKELFAELEFRTISRRVFGETPTPTPPPAPRQTGLLWDEPPEPETPEPETPAEDAASTEVEADAPAELKTAESVPHEYHLIDTPEKRQKLVAELESQPTVSFDTETTGLDPKSASIVGLAFSCQPHTGTFVSLPAEVKEADAILQEFAGVLESKEIEKVGHNLKFDLSVLRWHGVAVKGPLFDTMLAHSLLEPEMRHRLDYLAEVYLGYAPISISRLIGEKGAQQKSMQDVPLDQLTEYAAEDADLALQLKDVLEPLLRERNAERVCREVEFPLVKALVEMEHEGIAIDSDALGEFSEQLAGEIEALQEKVFQAAGQRFNLNSPKQLGEILFDVLKLESDAKKTRTGQYATSEQVLTGLASRHQIVRDVLDYRSATKLKTVYVDQLPAAVNEKTGRVHTTYNQAWTVTGRMSSSDPNLQNIPIRTEQGQEIRKAFIPRSDDYLLLAADYSQIELRIMAELSQDEAMMEAFVNEIDIHSVTASKVNGVPLDEVTREMRGKAKMVNFGIIYGISAFGLSQRLDISRDDAGKLIGQYFLQYPGVKNYMESIVASAREHGYVETMTGRRRYLRDINSRNLSIRSREERNAINSPIQGTAADMIKLAMARIHDSLTDGGYRTRMLLQVHDELVFDMHREEEAEVKPIIETAMKTALPMKVPIVVEMGTGTNWLEAH